MAVGVRGGGVIRFGLHSWFLGGCFVWGLLWYGSLWVGFSVVDHWGWSVLCTLYSPLCTVVLCTLADRFLYTCSARVSVPALASWSLLFSR